MQMDGTANPQAERLIQAKGESLFALMQKYPQAGIFSKKGAYARIMDWSMKDPVFKTQLFRFVDVLPSLQSSTEIVRHLQEYLGDKAVELNPALKAGLAASSFAPALVAAPVKAQIVDMAGQFVAARTGDELIKQIKKNASLGIATTIDLLGEAVINAAEADVFLERNLEILNSVSRYFEKERTPCFSDLGAQGCLPRLNLSIKISALTPDVHPADPEDSIKALKNRLRPILRRASEVGAFINFDMESYKLKDLTLDLFKSIFTEEEFITQPAIGIAIQAYLRESEHDLKELIAWARKYSRPISVRLVKGAYWDSETILAQQKAWPIPVWQKKPESDANYEKLSILLLDNSDIITANFASHNVRSCAHAIVQAEARGIDPKAYEFQALYGMADELKAALVQSGHRVREYCPVGELLPGMAYLVRRLLENTSNEGFLRIKDRNEATTYQLLANPLTHIASAHEPLKQPEAAAGAFVNAANTDYTLRSSREKQLAALNDVPKLFGAKWPVIINGKRITDRTLISSVNPAKPSQVIGYYAKATREDAELAVKTARAAFLSWSKIPVEKRCEILFNAASIMEQRRFELNAWEVYEAGKPWIEADADISEAIDFCRYYATEIKKLQVPTVTQHVPGEKCTQSWTPRGVGVAIAPWNFPLAILTGLVVAPLVAGNAVIIKPAEQTVGVGMLLMEILTQAGVPDGVLSFIPGSGEEVGAYLVAHKDIDFIAFTGSRDVGCKIWETAGKVSPQQANLKKVVCEMGGKNALIIDNDADLDEAVPAALYSAFGFSGQKCSALSRLIVLDEVYERFVERFVAACATYKVGDPVHPGTMIGPVIDEQAKHKISELIESGKREATCVYQGSVPTEGYFVPPTVFTEPKLNARIIKEEIFGPVVSIIKVKTLTEAFNLVNDCEYALTGGLFSRSPKALERAISEMQVGNLYLNRSITGAMVERHPFGGYKMSGGGTKAGGNEYLQNFLFPKSIVENVLRRGFTPVETS